MKKKITFAALVWAALLALSGCGDKPENVSESVVSVTLPNKIDIFNIENQSDMAVTLYYDVDEPRIIGTWQPTIRVSGMDEEQ